MKGEELVKAVDRWRFWGKGERWEGRRMCRGWVGQAGLAVTRNYFVPLFSGLVGLDGVQGSSRLSRTY